MMDCARAKSCPGSLPFFVGRNNPRFRYARNGYMPSQCLCPDYEEAPLLSLPMGPLPNQAFEQVKAELTFLRNKVAELQTKRKPRGEY